MQTLQGKVTTYDYYAALEKLTDNVNVRGVKDRYSCFTRVMREWRSSKMLKRGGRGQQHDNRGVGGTLPGEIAVRCPACPIPGVNLPEDWNLDKRNT